MLCIHQLIFDKLGGKSISAKIYVTINVAIYIDTNPDVSESLPSAAGLKINIRKARNQIPNKTKIEKGIAIYE